MPLSKTIGNSQAKKLVFIRVFKRFIRENYKMLLQIASLKVRRPKFWFFHNVFLIKFSIKIV